MTVSRSPGFHLAFSIIGALQSLPTQVAKSKAAGRKGLPKRSFTPKHGLHSLLFAKGFPSSPEPKLPSCFFADCHWNGAISHPQGGWAQERSDTADLGSVPRPHDPLPQPGDPSLCWLASLGSLPFVSLSLPPNPFR